MKHISSSATLFLKLILPTVYVVFFGMFLISLFVTDLQYIGPFSIGVWRLGSLVLLLIGIGLIYGTLFQLKRVELDEQYIYATDYFKTYRYPYHHVEKIVAKPVLFFPVYQIHLQEAGAFGRKISFWANRRRLADFMALHPDIAQQLGFA